MSEAKIDTHLPYIEHDLDILMKNKMAQG